MTDRKKPRYKLRMALMTALGLAAGIGIEIVLLNAVDIPSLTVLLLLAAALVLSVVVHECGHLLGGLLSGWRFVYIGAFSWVLMKKRGKLGLYRLPTPGAQGVCCMTPPPLREGRYPYRWFLAGGGALCGLCSLALVPLTLYARHNALDTLFAGAFLAAAFMAISVLNLLP